MSDAHLDLDLEFGASDPVPRGKTEFNRGSTSLEEADRINHSIVTLATRQRVYENLLPPGYKPKVNLIPTHSLAQATPISVTRPRDVTKVTASQNRNDSERSSSQASEKVSKSYLGAPAMDTMRRARGMHKEVGGFEPEFHLLPNGGLLDANGLGPVLVSIALMCMLVAALAVPWVYATHSVVVSDQHSNAAGSQVCSWMEMRGWSSFQCTRLRDSHSCVEFFNDFNCTNYNWRDALDQRVVPIGHLGTIYDIAAVFLFLALCIGFALLMLFVIRCTSRDHSGKSWWHIYLVAAGAICLFIALTTFAWSYADAFRSTFSGLHRTPQSGAALDYNEETKECDVGPCASFWGADQGASHGSHSRWGPAGWYFALFAFLLHAPLAYWSTREGDEGLAPTWTSWQLGAKSGSDALLGNKESIYLS